MACRIIEIMGCAATGKSSVTRCLLEQDERFRVYVPTIGYRVQCRKYTLFRFPQILFFCLIGVRRHYLKTLIRIEAALETISSEKKKANGVLLVDQGPLSSLAYLYSKGVANQVMLKWLKSLNKKAANVIDKVFWLDASNSVLVDRLNKRRDGHKMENMPEVTTNQFYDTYRLCYNKVLKKDDYEISHFCINTSKLSIWETSRIIQKKVTISFEKD
ncbi:MAG: hypothetical protein B6I25_03040 [Planctomycetales bacterium 4572_13]|nr:MAG: hypothetical protein B6I25_03040 [Planctomycetales bacterium 4572_13]RKY08851.1 MAG: hypothetical protein DRP56_03475 [Planctomycetota bacterium]